MTRPKDMEPGSYSGEKDDWPVWRGEMGDFIGSFHPGMKGAMAAMAKGPSEIIEHSLPSNDPPYGREEWALSEKLLVMLRRKTSGEARNVVMCVDRQNGCEAWRGLAGRFEACATIRRMTLIAELNAL